MVELAAVVTYGTISAMGDDEFIAAVLRKFQDHLLDWAVAVSGGEARFRLVDHDVIRARVFRDEVVSYVGRVGLGVDCDKSIRQSGNLSMPKIRDNYRIVTLSDRPLWKPVAVDVNESAKTAGMLCRCQYPALEHFLVLEPHRNQMFLGGFTE